jgi:hypothetical protein
MRGSLFFDGVVQAQATLGGRSVPVPAFYYDGCAIGAVFPARLGALRRLMPDPRIAPARLAPGLGAVSITCFEYRDTDIGPYNELAISVLLNEPWLRPNLPGRALLSGRWRRQIDAFVWQLPVTTAIARDGGVELYNYPKFLADIDFAETGSHRTCRLSEAGQQILSLAGQRIRTCRSEKVQLFSHQWMDRQPQGSEFAINALRIGVSMRPGAAALTLGDAHPIGRQLRSLLVSFRPIQYQYLAGFEGVLYGPEHLTLRLLKRLAEPTSTGAPAGSS